MGVIIGVAAQAICTSHMFPIQHTHQRTLEILTTVTSHQNLEQVHPHKDMVETRHHHQQRSFADKETIVPSTNLPNFTMNNDTLVLPSMADVNVIVSQPLSTNLPNSTRRKEHFVIYSTSNTVFFKARNGINSKTTTSVTPVFTYTFPTAQYAKRFNYSYLPHPDTFNYEHERLRGHRLEAHYYRIFAALQLMRNQSNGYSGPPIDWLVYLDTDAFIAEPNLPLEAIVDAANIFAAKFQDDSDECHFITQEHSIIANSGFFLVRNSPWSIKFFERWLDECEKPVRDKMIKIKWVWDQGPLQNAILHVSIAIHFLFLHYECVTHRIVSLSLSLLYS
jgi:hypothetical protein